MRVVTSQTIDLFLDDEDAEVLPGRARGSYVLLKHVSVSIRSDMAGQRVYANGDRCKKDGTFSEHWGRTIMSVDLPDDVRDKWVAFALRQIRI